MADESFVRGLLTAHAALIALVPSGRIWDEVIPASVPSPAPTPYIVMTTVTEVPENTLAETPGVAEFRVQFDIYGDSKSQVRSVVAAMRGALEEEGTEEMTRPLPTDDPALRRLTSDWRFWLPR